VIDHAKQYALKAFIRKIEAYEKPRQERQGLKWSTKDYERDVAEVFAAGPFEGADGQLITPAQWLGNWLKEVNDSGPTGATGTAMDQRRLRTLLGGSGDLLHRAKPSES